MSFFERNFFDRTRFLETRSLSDQNCMLKKIQFLKVTEKNDGFEIRHLHHFARKNVPHTIYQNVMITEIQRIRSNQLMTKKSIILNWVKLKNLLAFWKEDRSLNITVPSGAARRGVPHLPPLQAKF